MTDLDGFSADQFLALIAGEGKVTFQTFDESPRKRGALTKVMHGYLSDHRRTLDGLNQEGAGVFFMVNAGDGRGRRASNVTAVRALFVDLDGSPLEPVLAFPMKPHLVVETSPKRYQAFWSVDGVAPEDFTILQSNIASMFDGDPVVKDLPRVMRLPGFLHNKREPFLSRVLALNDLPKYNRADVGDAFGMELRIPTRSAPKLVALDEFIPQGQRNATLFGLARGLVNKGFAFDEALSRIQQVNANRCRPILCATEVDALVESAYSHPAAGSLNLPLAIFDSAEYRGLSHAARTITALAYRRFNGQNNGNIALPFSEFRVEFKREQTFYNARREAVNSGLLRRVRKARYHVRGGREPDLYEVSMTPPSVVIHKRSACN